MFLVRTRKTFRRVTGLSLALALAASSVADNQALCPDGERLLRLAEAHGGDESAPAVPPAACATDSCETPALVPVLHLPKPVITGVEVLVTSNHRAGLGVPAPPAPPPKRDA